MATSEPAHDALSAIDTAWYRMEEAIDPVDIGALLILERPLELQELCRVLDKRLLRLRRFRQRVIDSAIHLTAPHWEDDPDFSLRAHLHRVVLPAPGDKAALEEMVSKLMSVPIDLSGPPWQMYLIEGVGEGSALFARFHHCMGDGFALAHLLLSVADESPHPDSSDKPRQIAKSPDSPKKRGGTQLVDGAKKAGKVAASLGHLVMLPFDPHTVLRQPLEGRRRASWSRGIALTWIKAIGRARGGATVNDVLMTALTGSLRRYLIGRGEPVDALSIHAIVPVNLRPVRFIEEMGDDLGNRFGLVFATLPVKVASPHERMERVKAEMDRLKASAEAFVAFGLLGVLGRSPTPLERAIRAIFARKASIVATNVPGPRRALYLAGNRIVDVLFWVPHPARLGLGLSILSYDGCVRIGVRSDTAVVPDPHTLVEAFEDELDALAQAFGLQRH
ncbi:MAG: wax ester/triacylglycerol synthase family O-acyltransferase [Bradymonadaceae bacterium]|nr:wax ester/triacylglycerol synthase family O-acyltransferase [Lujinxingiaceae bacterium]